MKTTGDALRDMALRDRSLGKTAAWRYATSTEAEMQQWELLAADYRSTHGSDCDDAVQLPRWADRMGLDPVDMWAVQRILGVRKPEQPTAEAALLSLLADLEGAVVVATERRIELGSEDYAALESIEATRRRVVAFVRDMAGLDE